MRRSERATRKPDVFSFSAAHIEKAKVSDTETDNEVEIDSSPSEVEEKSHKQTVQSKATKTKEFSFQSGSLIGIYF